MRYPAMLMGALRSLGGPRLAHMHLGAFDGVDDFEAAQTQLMNWVLAPALATRPTSWLDVGFGLGATLGTLRSASPELALTGLNIDPAQVAWVRDAWPADTPAPTLVVGDACAMPFADAAFDALSAIECAFHFPSRPAFVAEVQRVLRPGGVFVWTDIVAGPSVAAIDDDDLHALRDGLGPIPDPTCESGGVGALARRAFRDVDVRDITASILPSFARLDHADPPDETHAAVARGNRALGRLLATGGLVMELGTARA